ncbi:MAG TPA: hypothetical protein VKA07_06040 [Candidatus Sulfotelmatobacter sp.]|nr:hypothetical protein [Candidatus Sulfotelmatobacter sp.]
MSNSLSQVAKTKTRLCREGCPFCLLDKRLIESHLISKGIYSLVGGDANEAIRVNSRLIMHTSRQTKDVLLCQECDNSLNRNGENWIIPKLARADGKFFFLDILQELPPDTEKEPFKVYGAAKNPSIDVNKIVHFAMGIFWKASVHSWTGNGNTPRIELGPYRDHLRDFLRGDAPFPKNVSLNLFVQPRNRVLIWIAEPSRGKAKACRNFSFYVPGIRFDLYVGKQIRDQIRQLCFYANPAHPIVVYDSSNRFLDLKKEMERTARKSKRVKNLFI